MSQPEVVVVQPDPPPKYEVPSQPEQQPLTTVTTHQEVQRPQLGKNSGSKFRGVKVSFATFQFDSLVDFQIQVDFPAILTYRVSHG